MIKPVEIDSIIPPAGSVRVAGGRTVLDLSSFPLGTNIEIAGTLDVDGAITAGTTLAIGTGASIGGTGAGTAAALLTLNKTAAGVNGMVLREANALRATVGLDASEDLVLEVFTGAVGEEASQGSLTIDGSTGDVTLTDGLTVGGDFVVNGDIDLGTATVVPRWHLSQEITFADLGSGATGAVAITGLPAGAWHVLAVHVETGTATTSSDGGTTGLTIQVGHTGGDVDALVASTSIFGADSIKVAPAGVEVGGYVDLADDVAVLFTATGGGTAELDHINAMQLKVGFLLAPAPAAVFA